jgi:nucleoside phosphorylase
MCGIARAVPHPEKPEDHVRLGDIVVSSGLGVIQYDRGKQRDLRKSVPSAENSAGKERFAWKILRWLKSRFAREVQNPAGTLASDPFVGFDFRGPPRPPCPVLLQAVKRIHADEELLGPRESRVWESKIEEFLRRSKEPGKWKRPSSTKDKLVDSPDGRGAGTRHPKDNRRRSGWPRVFRGPIGAANIVQADPRRRDALRERHDIRAVEMEGSGVADAAWVANTGYLVVRGTCDYCNSTKGDDWHHCAALIAAAYTRTVIEYLHPILPPTVSSVPEVPTLDPSKLLPIGSPLVAKHLPGEPPSVATLAEATPARSSQAEAVAVLQKAPAGIAVKPAGTAPDIDPGQPETAVSAGLTQRMAGETQAGGADVVASSAISDPGLFTRSLMLAWK